MSIKELSAAWGVSEAALRNLVEEGELEAFDIARKGARRHHWRITLDQARAFLRRRSSRLESGPDNAVDHNPPAQRSPGGQPKS